MEWYVCLAAPAPKLSTLSTRVSQRCFCDPSLYPSSLAPSLYPSSSSPRVCLAEPSTARWVRVREASSPVRVCSGSGDDSFIEGA